MLFKYCHCLHCLRITVYKSNVSPNVIEDLINACASLQELRVTCERHENSNEADFFFCLNEKVLSAVQMNYNLKKVYFLNSGINEKSPKPNNLSSTLKIVRKLLVLLNPFSFHWSSCYKSHGRSQLLCVVVVLTNSYWSARY